VPTPEANCLGDQRASYGWSPLKSLSAAQGAEQLPDEHCIQSYTLAEIFEGKVWSSFVQSDQTPMSKSFVAIDNLSFILLGSYLKEQNYSIFLRILNVSNCEQTAVIKLNLPFHAAYLCKLNEQTLEQNRLQQDQDKITIQAGANELLTVKVELIR
jgi:alpha-mannosidase